MLNKPKFRDSFQVNISNSEELVLFLSERQSYLIKGILYKLLATVIDGCRSLDEIVDELLPQLLAAANSPQDVLLACSQVYQALATLERQGHIVESVHNLPPQLAIFGDALSLKPEQMNERLSTTKVAVKAFGSISTSSFVSTLKSLQVNISDEADLDIVLTDDYLREEIDLFNQNALRSNRPWMLVKPVGTVVWIGPIFYPGKTGCWECLAHRLRTNRPIERYIQRNRQTFTCIVPPSSVLDSTIQTALGIAATEVLKWIVCAENKRLEGVVLTLDTLGLQIQDHILVKRPQCPRCGDENLNNQVSSLVLGNRLKTFTTDGGHRHVAPQETLHKYQHHISPVTGVLRGIEPIKLPNGRLVHSYLGYHGFVLFDDDLDTLHRNLMGGSAGKGKTDIQAKASVLGEALERYSGVFQGNEPRVKSSYEDLKKKAIHPNACMNFSQQQYDKRHEWNVKYKDVFREVPEPFDKTREIDWTPVWSLTHQDFKYLPTAYCYFGYPKSLRQYCWADSNGCATGNTLEEAILHGFMELVERDSIALWWYNRLKKPKVDLDSFEEPYFIDLQEYYRSLHRDLWVLDITSDLNIPTFVAVSRRTDREVEDIVFGFGTHFDPKIAISRALTEGNQILPSVLYQAVDGSTIYSPSSVQQALNWWKTATLENQPYLAPDECVNSKKYSDYPYKCSENLLDDIVTCQQIFESKGMEVLVLDQTRPDIGLKAVRAIVPGMRHYWQRLGPGRLYDVPIQMGWLSTPLSESELNPFPMWM